MICGLTIYSLTKVCIQCNKIRFMIQNTAFYMKFLNNLNFGFLKRMNLNLLSGTLCHIGSSSLARTDV